jgi:hypothetical protein
MWSFKNIYFLEQLSNDWNFYMYKKCKFVFIMWKICPKQLLNASYVSSFMVGVAKKKEKDIKFFLKLFFYE